MSKKQQFFEELPLHTIKEMEERDEEDKNYLHDRARK